MGYIVELVYTNITPILYIYRLSSDVDNGLIIHPINATSYKPNTYCSWYIEGNR